MVGQAPALHATRRIRWPVADVGGARPWPRLWPGARVPYLAQDPSEKEENAVTSERLHPSKIDISGNTRTTMIDLLNARLADAVDLATQMKQAHWNVKGPSFIALHELFDAVHTAVQGHVDNLAERITALGGIARGTARVAAAGSELAAYPLEIAAGTEHVEAVSAALAAFGKNIRAAIAGAAEAGDADTEDLLIEISRDIDKHLWLVEAHAQSPR